MGGGLSFLTAQYGWASTHIVNYELVTPNGTIINASRQSKPDLHRALQLAGNNLGVVTTFTLQTVPIGPVWGGYRVYPVSQTDKML